MYSLQATGSVNTTLHSRTRRTRAHVIFSRLAQDLSHRVKIHSVSQNSNSSHQHRISHAPSWLIPSHLSTTSLPHALQSDPIPVHLPDLRCCHLHMGIHPALIHRMCLSATWLMYALDVRTTGYGTKYQE